MGGRDHSTPRQAAPVYDAATERVHANVCEPAQIVVLDTDDLRVVRALDVPAAGPHGLALSGERLFCAADGGPLVALQLGTGEVLGSIALPGEPDVVMHDPTLAHLYVAVGAPGVVSVIDDRHPETLEVVPIESGAHTIGWHPDGRTLHAFLPASQGAAVFVEQ